MSLHGLADEQVGKVVSQKWGNAALFLCCSYPQVGPRIRFSPTRLREWSVFIFSMPNLAMSHCHIKHLFCCLALACPPYVGFLLSFGGTLPNFTLSILG